MTELNIILNALETFNITENILSTTLLLPVLPDEHSHQITLLHIK